MGAIREATRDSARCDSAHLNVALTHDWLVRYGGAERVLDELIRAFPKNELRVAVRDGAGVDERYEHARPSFIQRLPGAKRHHSLYLPLMPLAWRAAGVIADVDVVISSSYACAKAIRTAPGVPHICYCHTPIRYAWAFEDEQYRVPVVARPPARALMSMFRTWDASTASRVSQFVANSTAVAGRIAQAYGRSAAVVHPPVRTDFFTPSGERGDSFLYVGRLVAYKNAELVVRAFRDLPHRLVVVGSGHLSEKLRRLASPNVTFKSNVDDEELRDYYRSARALVYPANEDFGIVMAEAQACGTPVIALAAGGALDIVDHGATGWLLDRAEETDLRRAIETFGDFDSALIRASAERFSPERFREGIERIVAEVIADAA